MNGFARMRRLQTSRRGGMVDAHASGACRGNPVEVQVLSTAPPFNAMSVSESSAAPEVPVYAKEEGGRIVLDPDSLTNPEVFLYALKDYAREFGSIAPIHVDISSDSVSNHSLQRQVSRSQGNPTLEYDVGRRLKAISAELVLSQFVKDMLQKFDPDGTHDLHLIEWGENEEKSMLHKGHGVVLKPSKGMPGLTNTDLFLQGWYTSTMIGEIDMVVEVQKRAYFIDATISRIKISEAFENVERELGFERFRQAARSVFDRSQGKCGYESVAKLHVIINEDLSFDHPLSLFQNEMRESYYTISVCGENHVSATARAIKQKIRRSMNRPI